MVSWKILADDGRDSLSAAMRQDPRTLIDSPDGTAIDADIKGPTMGDQDAAANRCSLAPMIASQNIVATSPKTKSWPMVKTLSSCSGSSKPVKKNVSNAKQPVISQTPRKRGRKRDLYTSRPNGKSHRPEKIALATSRW